MQFKVPLTLGLCFMLFALPAAGQFGRGPKIKLETIASADAALAGASFDVALEVKLQKGIHVNSNTPLESYLIPTVLTLSPPDGVTLGEIAYPEALLLKTGGSIEPLAVYEEEFAIGARLEVDEGMAPGDYAIEGTLRYQACDEKQCFAPKTAKFTLSLTVAAAGATVNLQNRKLFESIAFSGPGATARPPSPAADSPGAETPGALGAAENDVLALLSEFDVLATTGGYLKKDAFLKFISDTEAGREQKGWFEGRGPIAIIVLILMGGLALNLTPCVLPMIPINLAIIGAGAQAGSRLRGFALGGAYGAAMAFVYGMLGLIVILTAGTFGTINSSPWFNAALALLFIVLALAMFDVVTIDFSRLQSKLNMGGKGKGTFLLAFGMGGVAALLAGACVAPAVIQVIVFSSDLYMKGAAIALTLPFVLGLGMALPWPLAGAGLSILPKPGPWMVRVKQAFGVFIFAFAAYYGYLSFNLFSDRFVDSTEVAGSVESMIEEGWVPSLAEGMKIAKAEDKMILVDMWATWCKNCLTMDKTTFKDPEVLAQLEDYVKVKFQAEDPSASPAREVMEHFEGIGLPTYAILRPKAPKGE